MVDTEGSRVRMIGIREAKGRLSELIRGVRRGQQWTITERGVPVAKLIPMDDEDVALDERLRRLESIGVLEPLRQGARPVPRPLTIEAGIAQRFLREDREARHR